MAGGRSSNGTGQRLGSVARATIFAVAAVALIGVALVAGGIGPWTDRSITVSPSKPRTLPPMSRTQPINTRPTKVDERHVPAAVSWGLRLLVIGVLVVLAVFIAVWLVRKFKEMAENRGERAAGEALPAQIGTAAPPKISERASGRDFDPRAAADAIISCWLWVESAAAAQGLTRRQQDTPTEFLERFVGRQHTEADEAEPDPAAAKAADVLLPLYQRARFDHVALTADAAITARSAAETLCAAGRGAAARVARAGPVQEQP